MRWFSATAALLALACGAPAPEVEVDAAIEIDAAAAVRFADVSREILGVRCAGGTCHGDGAVLSFAKRGFVIDAPARSAECDGGTIVVPFDPGASLLYTKLTSPPCGNMMPFSTEPMPPELIDDLRAWIADGAP